MSNEDLVTPVPGGRAFAGDARDEETAVSQTLQIVAVGAQLTGRRDVLSDDPDVNIIQELEAPYVADLTAPGRAPEPVTKEACAEFIRALGYNAEAALSRGGLPDGQSATLRQELWRYVRERDGRSQEVAAVTLMWATMYTMDARDLLRVAAASELTWIAGAYSVSDRRGSLPVGSRDLPREDGQQVIETLRDGLASEDEDAQEIASNALGGLLPSGGNDGLYAAQATVPAPPKQQRPGSKPESLIMHGTNTNKNADRGWWRPPNGDFYQYLLKHQLGKNLYRGGDVFEWSGNLDDHQREVAGKSLRWWADRPGGAGHLDVVFAHSHGGTVLQCAVAHQRLTVGLLVAMACPAMRWNTAEQQAIRENVGVVVSVRARHDLVLWADRLHASVRGRGRGEERALLGDRDIEIALKGIRLPGAGHNAVRKPKVWEEYGIPEKILQHAGTLGWQPS